LKRQRGLIRATTLDNPFLVHDYIENLAMTLTKELLEQWVFAQFVVMRERACYYNFNRMFHVNSTKAKFERGLPLRFTMDFNYNPLCASVGQQNKKGDTWTFEEIILGKASTWDLCEAFLNRFKGFKGDVIVYGDATGSRRQTSSRYSDYDIVNRSLGPVFGHRLKFKVPKKNPPVRDRLNAVNAMLKNANNDVRYYINPMCRKTIMDFETAETPDLTMFAIDKRDAAGQAKTHPTDAIGYWLSNEFPIIKPTYRSFGAE
jgi:hypothetical protein